MSEQVLEQTVQGFWNREYDVMVCTTIVETGLDIANANTLIVENAQNMGLSQLHQLRGRVGRGSRPSLCVAVTGAQVGSTAFHRLKAFASTTDGFALAEADLELRSEGDVLGASQSGRTSGLDLLRVTRDARLIATARRQAERIVAALTH